MTADTSDCVLGVAGDLVCAEDVSHWATKAGGCPSVPLAVPADALRQAATCKHCGDQRALVLQASAPAPSAPIRQLLVFLCTQPACCCSDHAFAALRVQVSQTIAGNLAITAAQSADGSSDELQAGSNMQRISKSPSEPAAGTLHVGASQADAVEPSGKPSVALQDQGADDSAAALDFADVMGELNALADKMQAAPPQDKSAKRAKPTALSSTGACAAADSHSVRLQQQLPEFWIDARAEPAAPSDAASSIDDAHVRRLLERYAESEEAASESGDDLQAPFAGRGGGEAYERDPAHERFRRRISRVPGQCVRYGMGAALVWPAEEAPSFPPCPHCGEQRALELQVMAPLWHYFEECLPWYDGLATPRPEGLCTDVLQQPQWDWLTVAVATCPESCEEQGVAVSIREEAAAGYNLLATHLGSKLASSSVTRARESSSGDGATAMPGK